MKLKHLTSLGKELMLHQRKERKKFDAAWWKTVFNVNNKQKSRIFSSKKKLKTCFEWVGSNSLKRTNKIIIEIAQTAIYNCFYAEFHETILSLEA